MAKAKDVEAGGAFYRLFAKDQLSGVLDRIKSKTKQFVAFMGSAAKVAGIAGAGLAAPLTALFKGGTDRAADVARMSQQFGVPIELLSRMQYAAEQAGVSIEEVMNDKDGRYSSLVKGAPTIDADRARQSLEMQRAMTDATQALQRAMLPLLDTIVPVVKTMTEFVKNNAHLVRGAAAAAVGLLVFAAAVKVTAVAFVLLKTAALAAYSVIGGPVLLGALAATVIVVGLTAAFGDLEEVLGFIGAGFKALGSTLKTGWEGISSALGRGDLKGAWEIALAALDAGWAELVHTLSYTWIGFKMLFDQIVTGLRLAWLDLTTFMAKAMVAAVRESLNLVSRVGSSGLAGPAGALLARKADAVAKDLPSGELMDQMRNEERDRILSAAANKEKSRVEEALAADAELAAKKQKLADLVGAEKEKDALDLMAKLVGGGAEAATPLRLAEGLRQADAVKGGFNNGALGLQFGAADQAQKQTELMKQLRDGEGKLPEKIAGSLAEVFKIK